MLQAIRERVTGIVAFFVLGLLAVPFLFFGMESYMRAVPQNAVAVVGDVEISTSDFQTSFANYRNELRQRQGDDYDAIATNQPMVRREHLETMIDQVLLREYAQDLGLQVGDQSIAEIIRGVPAFQVDGQFNPEIYRQALQRAGESPQSFERSLREDLLTRMVPTALSETAIVTESEIDRLISLQQQTRQISLVGIPGEQYADDLAVSEDDVEAFYQENLRSFTTEEQVRLAYVELRGEDLAQDATLGEQELRQRYEAASARYLTPEERKASHILIEAGDERNEAEARQLAEELKARIGDGESFDLLAAEFSDDFASAELGGDLGWIRPDDMVSSFEDALYALDEPGDISDPVNTQFGWHLIRLDEIRPPEGMSFEEAREEILDEYVERRRDDLYIELSDRMVDLVYADDSSLEPLAEALDLEIQHSDWITRSGGDEGVAAHPEVVEVAFSDLVLIDGAVSDPIEIDRNRMVAIKVAEHRPAEPRPLEEVADEIRSRLIDERSREMARERAEELAEQVTGESGSLESVAESADLELQTLEQVGRNDFQHGPAFVQNVFRLPDPGDTPAIHVVEKGSGYAVVRLEKVIPGNPATVDDSLREMMRRQIEFAHMGYEVSGLLAWLRDNTDIDVVEDRL